MNIFFIYGVGKDYSAFVVVDITEFPHQVVAKYRNSEIKPMLFPSVIYEIARSYNEAFILCEVNDVGDQVAAILQYDLEYQNLLMCSMRGRAGQIVGQGFSGKKTDNHIKYKECVSYENFRTLIIKNIFDIPPQFMCFKDIIVQHYKDKRDHIISELNKYIYESKFNESTIYIPIYRINLELTYSLLKGLLLKKELELKM